MNSFVATNSIIPDRVKKKNLEKKSFPLGNGSQPTSVVEGNRGTGTAK